VCCTFANSHEGVPEVILESWCGWRAYSAFCLLHVINQVRIGGEKKKLSPVRAMRSPPHPFIGSINYAAQANPAQGQCQGVHAWVATPMFYIPYLFDEEKKKKSKKDKKKHHKKRARSSSSSSSRSEPRRKKRARSSSSRSADCGLGEGKPYHGKYFHGAGLPPQVTTLQQLPLLAAMEALHIVDSTRCPQHFCEVA
jgi:hypothetical protein